MVLKHWFPRSVIAFLTLTSVALAGAFNRQPAGLIKGARLSYVSSTTIKVGVGYGEAAGEYWEIAPTDAYNTTGFALTGLAPSTNGVFQYIYIDKANSLFPAVTLINSTTAPAWSDSYMGWYNGDNRCVGAVFVTGTGAVKAFTCPDDVTYLVGTQTVVANGSASTNFNWVASEWSTADASVGLPVNCSAARIICSVGWSGSGLTFCRIRAAAADDVFNDGLDAGGAAFCGVNGWVDIKRNGTRSIVWEAQSNVSSNQAFVTACGYRIER